AAHHQVRDRLDLTFEDLGKRELKNIARPTRVYRVRIREQVEQASSPADVPPLLDRPSIAVLPFDNLSGEPEQGYFADGIAEDVTTALSRFRWFFVIARNSSFTYKSRAVDVRAVGRELGVRYAEEFLDAEAIERAKRGQAGWCGPEILRAAGEIALKRGAEARAEAEALFQRSLETAKQQKALSWQLRTTTSLVRLWAERGRANEALRVLSPVYRAFEEGLGTADLVKAKVLLDSLSAV